MSPDDHIHSLRVQVGRHVLPPLACACVVSVFGDFVCMRMAILMDPRTGETYLYVTCGLFCTRQAMSNGTVEKITSLV